MKSNKLAEVENKLANQRIHDYSLSPGGPPYHFLCYIPGKYMLIRDVVFIYCLWVNCYEVF